MITFVKIDEFENYHILRATDQSIEFVQSNIRETQLQVATSCVHASHAKSCDLQGTKGHACTHSLNRNNAFMNI